jgi:uncharacterized protein
MKENRHPIFSHYQTRPLADPNAPKTLPVSLDLGLTTTTVTRQEDGWQLPNGLILNFSQIAEINAQETSCFRLVNGKLLKVEAFSENTNRYYSLMPTAKAPSMLISGIPMHRIKGTTPVEDTDRKMRALGKPYGQILDTATGLGYTAIQAAKTAQRVFTVEFDPAVLSICQVNPWSQGLFNHPKITQIIGDSWDIASFFPDETLNAIIHDPPTFNLAGHLYSKSLYEIFHRILKANGRLYHYIGDPDSRSGASTGRGVVERLRQSGFEVVPKGDAFGVLAKKTNQPFNPYR